MLSQSNQYTKARKLAETTKDWLLRMDALESLIQQALDGEGMLPAKSPEELRTMSRTVMPSAKKLKRARASIE